MAVQIGHKLDFIRVTVSIDVSPQSLDEVVKAVEQLGDSLQYQVAEYDPKYNYSYRTEEEYD